MIQKINLFINNLNLFFIIRFINNIIKLEYICSKIRYFIFF